MSNSVALMDYATIDHLEAQERIVAAAIPTLDLGKLATTEAAAKSFIIPKFAPAGEVTLFTGAGSAGKSLLAQQLATGIAAGVATLGLNLIKAPAIYITCEDDAKELHWRQSHICRALDVPMCELDGMLYLASLRGELDNSLGLGGHDGEFRLSPAYERLAKLIQRVGASFVALDNVAHLFTGNENDRGEVTRFVNALNRLAGETGAAIVLLGHPNKSGDSYSGSTAWLNAVRSQFVIEHDLQTDIRTLKVCKANYARKGDVLRFGWAEWAFALESELAPDKNRELAETIRANGENEAFLRCLTACNANKRNVSHQPGSNYAPKIFVGMPESKGHKKEAFAAAMERLLHIGMIELDADLWSDNHRHMKRGIRVREGQA